MWKLLFWVLVGAAVYLYTRARHEAARRRVAEADAEQLRRRHADAIDVEAIDLSARSESTTRTR